MAVAVLGALVAATCILIAYSASGRRPNLTSTPGQSGAVGTHVRSTTTTLAPVTTTTDPGVLPQTAAFPPASDPAFTVRMKDLWSGVYAGTGQYAIPAFFPETAYVQLKAVGNAQADFSGRLITEYDADVDAAHDLLGARAAGASLVGVNVNSEYAHWVPPGACYNRVGYFEVPNSRMVYSIDGQISSFGIASMISWRGEWYIVHLGAVLRSGGGGEVDAPQFGPGNPAYSSTC